MKFNVLRSSDFSSSKKRDPVELNTIDDLLAFIRAENWPVIVSCDGDEDEEWSLELYDDYRE